MTEEIVVQTTDFVHYDKVKKDDHKLMIQTKST